MAKQPDDGRVWGRPEALDTLGRLPGRWRRALGTTLGVVAIAAGGYVALTSPAAQQPGAGPVVPTSQVVAGTSTCASIALNLPATRVPAEGIGEASVVRLSRAGADGSARLMVAQAYVLKVTRARDGIQMSVLVRTAAAGEDETVNQLNGASADGSLAVAVLYDVDPLVVLDECRRKR